MKRPWIPLLEEGGGLNFLPKNLCNNFFTVYFVRSLLDLGFQHLVCTKQYKTETLDKCGVIYELSCQDCTSSYVGETARTLRSRVDDHKKPCTSPVYDHAANSIHSIDYEGVIELERRIGSKVE